MISGKVEVLNKAGIHARPAQLIVQTAETFYCEIFIVKSSENFKANAKSIFNVMALAAECGDELEIITKGDDEDEALETMMDLFENGFKMELR